VNWLCSLSPQADILDADRKVISPDFAFVHAWTYNGKLTELQTDINDAVHDVQVGISAVVASSTDETLQQYEDLFSDVEALFKPTLALFNELRPSNCRNSAERILNDTTDFTGFDASNCAKDYNIRVTNETAAANGAMARFDDLYSQVQTIVYKAFVGENFFITPEDIRDTITDIFDRVQARWLEQRPEMEAVRRNLASVIAAQNAELGNCHVKILDDATTDLGRFSRMVNTCRDFDNTNDPFSGPERAGRDVPAYIQQLEEFEAEFAKRKLYEWTA